MGVRESIAVVPGTSRVNPEPRHEFSEGVSHTAFEGPQTQRGLTDSRAWALGSETAELEPPFTAYPLCFFISRNIHVFIYKMGIKRLPLLILLEDQIEVTYYKGYMHIKYFAQCQAGTWQVYNKQELTLMSLLITSHRFENILVLTFLQDFSVIIATIY